MTLDNLFSFIDNLIGDVATFQGLTFTLEHGAVTIDYVHEMEVEDDLVSGYWLTFIPYEESLAPFADYALDEEGLKFLISEYVLV